MRIAICTPVHGDTRAGFTASLARMLVRTLKERPDFEIEMFMRSSSLLSRLRDSLAGEALEWGADWIFWLDSDQTFPNDALLRLMGHGEQIVGTNYPRRGDPVGPTAARMANGRLEPVWTTLELAEAGTVEEVHQLGFGVCLISAEAMRATPQPWFASLDDYGGEDTAFFARAHCAGVPLFVDHGLSWEVGHINLTVLTNVHAVMDRARWKLKEERTNDANAPLPSAGDQ